MSAVMDSSGSMSKTTAGRLCQAGTAGTARTAPTAPTAPTAAAMPAWLLRGALVVGCAASVALVASVAHPPALPAADIDLVRLLRGMAVIKASVVAAALGLLWWRAGHAVDARIAAGYATGLWWMAGASVAIWQLDHIVIAAGFFHAGLAAVLWAAWRDDGETPARHRRSARWGRYRVARRRTQSM